MYNWGGSRPGYDADSKSICRFNYVGNYGKPGPDSDKSGWAYEPGSKHFRAYFSGNHFFGHIPEDPWSLVKFDDKWKDAEKVQYKQSVPFSTGPIVTETAEEAYRNVMLYAGASLVRDAVDTRVIREVESGSGSIIDSQNDVGGWPEYRTYGIKKDTDGDGMQDQWEKQNGLDPDNPEDRNKDKNGDGYTNLETYLNGLITKQKQIAFPGAEGYGRLVEISAKANSGDDMRR